MSDTPDKGMAAESKELPKEMAEAVESVQRPSSATGTIDILMKIAKKMFFVGAIYFVGWMNWSVAWFICPVIVSAIRDQWKIESDIKRNVAKSSALHNEKDMILARIDELPAWVFFPDVERCEWLNKIFKQCWPNANQFTKSILKDKIEPSLRKALSAYKLNGFQFDRIVLGTIPIRIGGIKVYEKNIARNEIILDMDIFYAGDCDINFSIGAMRAGIKDFQIHGMVRVVLKPLINDMPLVGGMQVFFLNNPNIDFNLVGVADFLDFPGISDLLRRIIVEQIAAIMVLPNKLPFILSDKVGAATLKMPQPEGVLRIHVVEAKDLMKKDISVLGKGKSDPYCIITVGAQQFKTQTIMNNVNPKWDYWCEASIDAEIGTTVTLQIMDKDDATDDKLGRATIEISTVARKGELDTWLTLEEAKHGMVHLRLTWLSLTADKTLLKAALEETQMLRVSSNLNSAILNMFVDSVKNLPLARASSNPDPYVVLSVGKSTQQTTTVMRDNSPVFEQGFTFLVANPENDVLNIKVMDSKTGNTLGQLNFLLSVLLEKSNLETIQSQPFNLQKSGAESKIHMSMSLRILKKAEAITSSEKNAPISAASSVEANRESLSRSSSVKASSPLLEHQDSKLSMSSGISEQISVQEEPFVMTTVNPALSMPAPSSPTLSSGLLHRTPSMTSSTGQFNLGRIQMTIRYSIQRQKLVIIIHKIMHIPLKDPSNIPDPYVKLYLLPSRSKDSKRKTRTIKDNCNPVFDETFEYVISTAELNNTELEVTVCTQKGFLSGGSPTIGMVKVQLNEPEINQQGLSNWFDLHPENRLE